MSQNFTRAVEGVVVRTGWARTGAQAASAASVWENPLRARGQSMMKTHRPQHDINKRKTNGESQRFLSECARGGPG
ncbi:MAG: hypothetical protein Kow00120_01360 [Anaerolineae bacterium]